MTYFEWEASMMKKACALLEGCHPMHNIIPMLEAVKQADAVGCDLVRRETRCDEASREERQRPIEEAWPDAAEGETRICSCVDAPQPCDECRTALQVAVNEHQT